MLIKEYIRGGLSVGWYKHS